MKMYVNYFLLLAVFVCQQGCRQTIAKDQSDWGPVTNNIQMSISVESSADKMTTNEPVKIQIRYRNISTNEIFVTYVVNGVIYDPEYLLFVISPSGKDITPDLKKYSPGSGVFISISPKQVATVEFNLSSVCNLSEVGTYRIMLKRERFTPQKHTAYTIVSNPLLVKIVPN